jgi:hypothetical protein
MKNAAADSTELVHGISATPATSLCDSVNETVKMVAMAWRLATREILAKRCVFEALSDLVTDLFCVYVLMIGTIMPSSRRQSSS